MKSKNRDISDVLLTYEEAEQEIRNYLQKEIGKELEEEIFATTAKEKVKKDKEYLRTKKAKYRDLINGFVRLKQIEVRGYQLEKKQLFIDKMVAEFAGYSVLEEAFADRNISDIYVLAWDTIFVEKNGVNEKYPHKFRSAKHYEDVLKRFLGEAQKEINQGDAKIIHFQLYEDRFATTANSVSPRDYSLTIRKHFEDHITLEQLLKYEVIDSELSDLLGILIEGETNLICAGLTGSGKTTTIRALLDFHATSLNKRMIVAEDTQELFPKNEHTLELVSVESEDESLAVSLRDIIFTTLRLKPKYIVVGEVRGVEAEAAVEAMETGHSTIFTMHGGSPWNIINRLVTKYLMAMPNLGIDVVERIIGSGVDYIFIQDNIPGIGRKVTTLTEIGYDFENKRVTTKTICRFDFEERKWVWENKLDMEKIDKMIRRGVSLDKLKPWMEGKKTGRKVV